MHGTKQRLVVHYVKTLRLASSFSPGSPCVCAPVEAVSLGGAPIRGQQSQKHSVMQDFTRD